MLPIQKLESLTARYAEIEELLCQPYILSDTSKYTSLNRERAELEPVVAVFARYRDVDKKTRGR